MSDYSNLRELIESQHGYEIAAMASTNEPKEIVRHQARMIAYRRVLAMINGTEPEFDADLLESYVQLSRAKIQSDKTLPEKEDTLEPGVGVQ